MSIDTTETEPTTQVRWRPLEALERRILGVLVEKAKTTPENYPLSLNALRTGCNQKNNRSPLMQVEEDQVDEALESLRKIGAVAEIQGGGRVNKYRHLAYEWLGVDKIELAVMAELLLRGTQTVGELRGRAARMEPIKDMSELRPVLDSLQAKGLVIYLTPEGRGAVVTHLLYLEREMEKVRREAGNLAPGGDASSDEAPSVVSRTPATTSPPSVAPTSSEVTRMRAEIVDLRREVAALRTELESSHAELRKELDELNRQLGN